MFSFSLFWISLCFDIHRSFKFASREHIVSYAFWMRLNRVWSLFDFIDRIVWIHFVDFVFTLVLDNAFLDKMFHCHCQFFHFVMMNQRHLDVFQTFDALSICFYDDRCDLIILFVFVRINFSFRVRLINFVSSRRYFIVVVYRDFERINSWRSRVWLNKYYIVFAQFFFQSNSFHRCKCFSQFRASFSFAS